MSSPRVELLYWPGCPSWPGALEQLRDAMESVGLDPAGIVVTQVGCDEHAEGVGFVGSPTIRVDGRDIVPPGDEPVGLTCRIYRLRDGRVSPTPDPADVLDALRAVAPTQARP